MKKEYTTPKILKIKYLSTSPNLLSGSVVEKAEVTSAGQEVVDYDFSNPEFNHEWEWN